VLRNKIVRVGSTTSAKLDKATLQKMKQFEIVSQHFFGGGPTKQ